VFPFNTLEIMQ